MHKSYRLAQDKHRCTLQIHPYDADRRNIADGALVEVASRVRSVQPAAELTDEVMQRLVSMPHG